MPTYSYHCSTCDNQFDKLLPLDEYNIPQKCPSCDGKKVVKILKVGGIQDDSPAWLDDSVRRQIQDTDSPHTPITTRTQYKQHLKDNGIIPTR
jgi:putative FmdB family regulatory protein